MPICATQKKVKRSTTRQNSWVKFKFTKHRICISPRIWLPNMPLKFSNIIHTIQLRIIQLLVKVMNGTFVSVFASNFRQWIQIPSSSTMHVPCFHILGNAESCSTSVHQTLSLYGWTQLPVKCVGRLQKSPFYKLSHRLLQCGRQQAYVTVIQIKIPQVIKIEVQEHYFFKAHMRQLKGIPQQHGNKQLCFGLMEKV